MKFDEVLEQIRELLAAKGRVTYRALKVRLDLTDELLAACTEELIEAERVAADEDGKVLVWVGTDTEGEKAKRGKGGGKENQKSKGKGQKSK